VASWFPLRGGHVHCRQRTGCAGGDGANAASDVRPSPLPDPEPPEPELPDPSPIPSLPWVGIVMSAGSRPAATTVHGANCLRPGFRALAKVESVAGNNAFVATHGGAGPAKSWACTAK
jgi:hypothetical protein